MSILQPWKASFLAAVPKIESRPVARTLVGLPAQRSVQAAVQKREKLPDHRLPGRNRRYARQQRLIAVAPDAIAKYVDDGRPPRPVGSVLKAAVDHQRMME